MYTQFSERERPRSSRQHGPSSGIAQIGRPDIIHFMVQKQTNGQASNPSHYPTSPHLLFPMVRPTIMVSCSLRCCRRRYYIYATTNRVFSLPPSARGSGVLVEMHWKHLSIYRPEETSRKDGRPATERGRRGKKDEKGGRDDAVLEFELSFSCCRRRSRCISRHILIAH